MVDTDPEALGIDPIVNEAHRRYKWCEAWEAQARVNFNNDYKFANGDAVNHYQWPNSLRRNRDIEDRPVLTINIVQQHNLNIINDFKKNKPAIKVRATGNGASYEAQQVYEGLVRHIEYQSNAQAAYDTAAEFQVQAGWGYWRVATDYANDETFDQEIFIRRIPNPLNVYLDPQIQEKDGSDAKFGFIFDDIDKKEFDIKYPQWKEFSGQSALGSGTGWLTNTKVRIAEYFRLVQKEDLLLSYIKDEKTGQRETMRASQMPKELADQLGAVPSTRQRKVGVPVVEWYLIVGETIVDRNVWPGRYIPIVRCIGRETIIEQQLDRRGNTRAMLDPQRIYNFWTSSGVEHVALQGKTPWVAPASAIEGYETYYETANRINHAVLPYNDWDDQGQRVIQRPERAQPPVMAQAYLQGMAIAREEVQMATGQFEAQFGQQSNERTGKAISERTRAGDRATYDFTDNQAIAVVYTGKIIIDLIPKIYDTARVVKILARDGTDMEIKIDPTAQQAFQQQVNQDNEVISRVLNPNIGHYEVVSDIGPAYATKRQETFNAISLILTQAPQLTPIIGDLLFKSADFELADEIAVRLRRMVPRDAMGKGPSQQEQMLMDQNKVMEQQLALALQKLSEEKLRRLGKDQLRDIDAYQAETQRMDVIGKLHALSTSQLIELAGQLLGETQGTSLAPVLASTKPALDRAAGQQLTLPMSGDAPPVPGAQRAQDGQWYLPNPKKPGGWLHIQPIGHA